MKFYTASASPEYCGKEGYEVASSASMRRKSAWCGACGPRACVRAWLRGCGCCVDPRCFIALLLVAGCLLVCTHLYVLPTATKHYNEQCYLSVEARANMRHLLLGVATVLDDMNETWWVDYGTLLGVVRGGDILPHDADVDFGRLVPDDFDKQGDFDLEFSERLMKYNISGNQLSARYRRMEADIYQWKLVTRDSEGGGRQVYLSQHWPPWVQETRVEKLKYLLTPDLPAAAYLPPRILPLRGGHPVSVPRDYKAILRSRYPLTWWFTVPYKWRCYIPF